MKLVELNNKERSKYLLQDGDLLFARRSLVLEGSGKCSLVVHPSEETTFESSIIRARIDQSKAIPQFYYYFWASPLGRALMASIATRTAVSGIRGSDLVQLDVPLPPLPAQRKIAAVLSAYDDLIENNPRRIAVLERMARLLYQEWFVRFHFPGHEDVAMVDSELGPVPEGWEVKPLGEIAEQVRRNVKPDEVDPATPYIGLGHMPKRAIALSDWGRADETKSTKLMFRRGEILFGKIRPYFHKVGVAPVDGVSSTDAIVIVPKSDEYFSLVLACVSSDEFVDHATQTSQGTKMPRADWNVLVKYPVYIPPEPILSRFSE
jgi:type I restriction enzyme S subunit